MAGRRLLFLTLLAGCFVFHIAYGQWLSWILLVCLMAAPWLSLVCSIVPMLSFRICPAGEDYPELGSYYELALLGSCFWPMPPFRGCLAVTHGFTGKTLLDSDTLTRHCGAYGINVRRARVYDYLGLFSLPVWKKTDKTLLVRPKPIPIAVSDAFCRSTPTRWKVKSGGGYAENHEHRLYRPGDSLNQIHWKLTAKTGKLILREPMEPVEIRRLVTLNLRGTEEELDRKLGRLLWLGNYLLSRELVFSLEVLTGDGLLHFAMEDPGALTAAIDDLLCRKVSTTGDVRELADPSCRQFHIGGGPDEA